VNIRHKVTYFYYVVRSVVFDYFCNIMQGKKVSVIRHPGVVERVEGHTVVVRIESQAACGHCQAKSHCGMVESADKLVEVHHLHPEQYAAGQAVMVSLEQSLGYKALFLGYILPFLIMLTALFVVALTTANEALAALVAVVLMVPYYALLYRYRHKLRKTFHFFIQEK
jgi:positive regulator of sigma E activity